MMMMFFVTWRLCLRKGLWKHFAIKVHWYCTASAKKERQKKVTQHPVNVACVVWHGLTCGVALTSRSASCASERKDRMTPMMVILLSTLSTAKGNKRNPKLGAKKQASLNLSQPSLSNQMPRWVLRVQGFGPPHFLTHSETTMTF